MLKLLTNPINYLENVSSTTKCAEIHYITSNFNIYCVICHQCYAEIQEFIKHFQELHFLEFLENLTNVKVKNYPLLIENEKSVKQELNELMVGVEQHELKAQAEEKLVSQEDSQEEVKAFDHTYNFKEEDVRKHLSIEDQEDMCNNSEKFLEFEWSQTFSPVYHKYHEKRSYKPRNQPNSCSYCGKTFRRRYQLDTHLNIHTGLKPHQCDVCGRQFRAITTLQRHLNTHEKREIFHCQFCSKEFTHRAALVSHETRHTQERHIPCDECTKLFYTQNQLDTHRRKLHNKMEDFSLPFACDMCTKRYRSASMLSTHKFKKHYKMAKYDCEQCGKKFVEQGQLNQHMSGIHFKKC